MITIITQNDDFFSNLTEKNKLAHLVTTIIFVSCDSWSDSQKLTQRAPYSKETKNVHTWFYKIKCFKNKKVKRK